MLLNKVPLDKVWISGKLVDPFIEGGKGINASNGFSAGAWAACGGVGTISATLALNMDSSSKILCTPIKVNNTFQSDDRYERHLELIQRAIVGGISQIKIAQNILNNSHKHGCLNINVLWECGGVPQILEGILSDVNCIDGIVCGAGLPFDLAEIASRHSVYYNPIVSSHLAFSLLWRKSYKQHQAWLGSVVYECPWRAGGHNGISSREDPNKPENTYQRVYKLREYMNSVGLENTTIVIAGGVWNIADWIHNERADLEQIKPVAFQFGTRSLLTKESPISDAWKQRLLNLNKGDVKLNKFSPTGYYSSAINNVFLQELNERSSRQIPYSLVPTDKYKCDIGKKKSIYIREIDIHKVNLWREHGYTEYMETPSSTLIFVSKDRKISIIRDQIACKGCLNECKFSNFSQYKKTTKKAPDPRSFCIANTLDDIARGGSVEDNLMFAGTNVYKFAEDALYKNGYIPSVAELYKRICDECNYISH